METMKKVTISRDKQIQSVRTRTDGCDRLAVYGRGGVPGRYNSGSTYDQQRPNSTSMDELFWWERMVLKWSLDVADSLVQKMFRVVDALRARLPVLDRLKCLPWRSNGRRCF